jgi:hypothetical protein
VIIIGEKTLKAMAQVMEDEFNPLVLEIGKGIAVKGTDYCSKECADTVAKLIATVVVHNTLLVEAVDAKTEEVKTITTTG